MRKLTKHTKKTNISEKNDGSCFLQSANDRKQKKIRVAPPTISNAGIKSGVRYSDNIAPHDTSAAKGLEQIKRAVSNYKDHLEKSGYDKVFFGA